MKELKNQLNTDGFAIANGIYSNEEISEIINMIDSKQMSGPTIMKNNNLFAIRQFIPTIPEVLPLILNQKLIEIIDQITESEFFISKSIYFDKPSESNWFVAFHQDLSISVENKIESNDYSNWTFKHGVYGVQPPIKTLNDTITLRIHLDDTTSENGALKIIPKSHQHGIIRTDSKKWETTNPYTCEVKSGGVMLMKPLTLHASNRTTNNKRRRVIHIELNKHDLSNSINWKERIHFKKSIS